MIVDFQHHITPHALMPKDLGRRKLVSYDEHGAPSFIMHWMLFDLDEHIRMMDESGIDVAFLTSAAGMCADIEKSRLCNQAAKQAERDYPGRFIGSAHANPLGGAEALRELNRCKHELGFPGVVITSETNDLYIDAPEFEPTITSIPPGKSFQSCVEPPSALRRVATLLRREGFCRNISSSRCRE